MSTDRATPDPIEVLVVIDALIQGGAEQSTVAVLPRLVEQGIRPRVLCLRSGTGGREEELRSEGIEVEVLGGSTLHLVRALSTIIRRDPPAVLHVTLFTPIVVGSIVTLGTSVPVIASLVNTPEPPGTAIANPNTANWKLRLVQQLEAGVCRHLVTCVHTVTQGVADSAVTSWKVDPSRISVVERGHAEDRYGPATPEAHAATRRELSLDDDDEVVLAVGRHEHQKGLSYLVEAMGEVQQRRPRVHLVIAGREGNTTSALRDLVAALPAPDRVHLLGERNDVDRLLGAADVFVMSSLREGAAGAVVEAMASQVPIVATEVDGLDGILHDGVEARLVPIADPPALAAAITELLDDPIFARELAAAGRSLYLERFTLDRAVDAMARLYRKVAAEGRGRR